MFLIFHWRRLVSKPHLHLIALIGIIVPLRLRADWRQEWEAELQHRELLLASWKRARPKLMWGALARGGPRKVASRLVGDLKKAIERSR